MNRLEALRQRRGAQVLDLCDGRFHDHGYVADPQALQGLWDHYLKQRLYRADPQGAGPARDLLRDWYHREGLPEPAGLWFHAGTSEAYRLGLEHAAWSKEGLSGAGSSGPRAQEPPWAAWPQPAYPLFEPLAKAAGLGFRPFDLQPATWRLEAAALPGGSLPSRAAALVLVSPHNPTGRALSPDEIAAAEDWCLAQDALLLWDEVFEAYRADPARPLPRPQGRCRSLILNGISKRLASPDLKLAWSLALGPWTAAQLEDFEQRVDLYLSASSFALFALPRLWQTGPALHRRLRADLAANRAVVAETLGAAGALDRVFPGGLPDEGIHALLALPPGQDDELWCWELLYHENIYLQPGYYFGLGVKKERPRAWAALSFLCPPDHFRTGWNRVLPHLVPGFKVSEPR